MGLNYSFGLYADTLEDKKFWDDRYHALSKKDQQMYHETLPWLLMSVGINAITIESIPIIVEREKAFPICGTEIKAEDLMRFVGFTASVGIETTQEFLKKLTRQWKKITKKEVSKLLELSRPNNLKEEVFKIDALTPNSVRLIKNLKTDEPAGKE